MFMEISDQELRALVRDAIARHGRPAGTSAQPAQGPSSVLRADASHGRFLVGGGAAPPGGGGGVAGDGAARGAGPEPECAEEHAASTEVG